MSDATKLVLCPRRLEKKNGVIFFVRAAIELLKNAGGDLAFVIAGDFVGSPANSDMAAVREAIAQSPCRDRIKLLGRVENAEMPGLYALASVIVIPSLIEATSLSALEAMAAGKPLIASDVGGLPFLVRDGENGLLVPAGDVDALAHSIRKLVDNEALCRLMGAAARRRVEQELTWRRIAERTLDVYSMALQRSRDTKCPT